MRKRAEEMEQGDVFRDYRGQLVEVVEVAINRWNNVALTVKPPGAHVKRERYEILYFEQGWRIEIEARRIRARHEADVIRAYIEKVRARAENQLERASGRLLARDYAKAYRLIDAARLSAKVADFLEARLDGKQ